MSTSGEVVPLAVVVLVTLVDIVLLVEAGEAAFHEMLGWATRLLSQKMKTILWRVLHLPSPLNLFVGAVLVAVHVAEVCRWLSVAASSSLFRLVISFLEKTVHSGL